MTKFSLFFPSFFCICLSYILAFFFWGCLPREKKAEVHKIYFSHAFTEVMQLNWIEEKIQEWNLSQEVLQTQYLIEAMVRTPATNQSMTRNFASHADANDLAHLLHIPSPIFQEAYDSGEFLPLENLPELEIQDYTPEIRQYYTIHGQLYAIPFDISTPVLFINRNLLLQSGVDLDTYPTTLHEIMNICTTAQASGMREAGISFSLNSWYLEAWLAQQETFLGNHQNGRKKRATQVFLNSPELLKIIRMVKTLDELGVYRYTGKINDNAGNNTLFVLGKSIFHIASSADIYKVYQSINRRFPIAVRNMPTLEKATHHIPILMRGGGIWITKKHPKKEIHAAIQFLLEMTDTYNMMEWHRMTAYFPARRSSIAYLQKSNWLNDNKMLNASFQHMLQTSTNFRYTSPLWGSFTKTQTILTQAVQDILTGTDIEQRMTLANDEANRRLTQYNQGKFHRVSR